MALLEINPNPSVRELRQFGTIWFPAFFVLIGGIVLYASGSLPWALGIWIAAACVTLLGLALPWVTRLVFLGWMYAAYPIGWVISHLLLGVIFYGIVTPTGVLARLARGDSLHRRPDPTAATYWVKRETEREADRYFRQF